MPICVRLKCQFDSAIAPLGYYHGRVRELPALDGVDNVVEKVGKRVADGILIYLLYQYERGLS